MRDMTTAMQNQLEGRVLHPVVIVRLAIVNDPVHAWTGPGLYAPTGTGDAELDGFIFDPVEGGVDMSDVQEDQRTGRPTVITHTAHDLDEVLLRQVVRDKRAWLGRGAFIWFGALTDEKDVVADPTRIKTGVMTEMEVRREGDQDVITVTIDVDVRNAGAPAFRILDHPRIHSTDTFATFMAKLSNKGSRFTDRDVRAGHSEGLSDFQQAQRQLRNVR